MTATKRDTERGGGQERIVSAAALYGWTEVDYRAIAIDIPSSERAWTKEDRVFYVRLGEAGQVLMAWAYRGVVEDRSARDHSSVIGAVVDGRNKAGRAVDLLAEAGSMSPTAKPTSPAHVGTAEHDRSMATPSHLAPPGHMAHDTFVELVAAGDDEGFYPDDALPIHHLDEDRDGRQRGICPHSGASRTDTGGCPRGCDGATEHYCNDGHRACHDPAPVRPRREAER